MVSAFRILGEGQLSLTKFLLLTDQAVDLRDFRSTLQQILSRTTTETDLYVFANLSMDTLDYTGPQINRGSKGVWIGMGDRVRQLPEHFQWPRRSLPDVSEVHVFCPGCLVLGGASYEDDPGLGSRLVKDARFEKWPLMVLSDEPKRAAASSINFLWTTFTRFEPAADLYAADMTVVRNHISYRAPILIDARRRPGFPEELYCSPEIAELVSRRWREYFPHGQEMGDSVIAHLDEPAGC